MMPPLPAGWPRKAPPKPACEVLAEAKQLEARKPVAALIAGARHAAIAGDISQHPGFLRVTPRCSREVKRLLTTLGCVVGREHDERQAAYYRRALLWWDTGDAEADLLDEWTDAWERSFKCCQAAVLGHWPPPDCDARFSPQIVRKVMKGQGHWVGEVHYGWIKKQLLSYAEAP